MCVNSYRVGLRCIGPSCRFLGVLWRSICSCLEQSLRREDSASLAACSRMGRTSRRTGARSCAELTTAFPYASNLELDVGVVIFSILVQGLNNQAPR